MHFKLDWEWTFFFPRHPISSFVVPISTGFFFLCLQVLLIDICYCKRIIDIAVKFIGVNARKLHSNFKCSLCALETDDKIYIIGRVHLQFAYKRSHTPKYFKVAKGREKTCILFACSFAHAQFTLIVSMAHDVKWKKYFLQRWHALIPLHAHWFRIRLKSLPPLPVCVCVNLFLMFGQKES